MRHFEFNYTKEEIGSILENVKNKIFEGGKECDNTSVLIAFAITVKAFVDNQLEKGEEYELSIGKSEIFGDRFNIRSKVGETDFDHEFDAKTFIDLGFTKEEILAATLVLANDKELVATVYSNIMGV